MDKIGKKRAFSNMEISSFCGQFSMILNSGISSIEGISILLEDASLPEEKEILQSILQKMQESGSLYPALEHTGLFPSYMLQMIQIGEETGTLDEVMSALSTHYHREDSIHQNIRSAVTYPLIMTGMMVAVIIVLLVKVMPIFNQVFIQLGTEMTGFSRSLMTLGTTINRYSVLFTVIIALIASFIIWGTKTKNGRKAVKSLGYHFSFSRSFYEELSACRFAGGMALTLSSGLNPDRSMELVSTLNEDVHFQEKFVLCQHMVNDGKSLSEALHKSGIFRGMYAHLASIGEKTGSMDQAMNKIAELYQEDIDTYINNRLAVLEPTLVITLSLIVGVILMSVMFPLMGIMSSI
jgi:type IV pilus assembly protein PilC